MRYHVPSKWKMTPVFPHGCQDMCGGHGGWKFRSWEGDYRPIHSSYDSAKEMETAECSALNPSFHFKIGTATENG